MRKLLELHARGVVFSLFFTQLLAFYLCIPVAFGQSNRPVLGWNERVSIASSPEGSRSGSKKATVIAKLDTGADYSSLDASDLEEFEQEGKPWVRFSVTAPSGQKTSFEERVVRTALIKRSGGKHQSRNVIRLGICLGDAFVSGDVNLVSRANFKLQMLIGRNILSGYAAVDPALSFTKEPTCKSVK